MVKNNGTIRIRREPLIQHDRQWSCGVDHDSFNLNALLPKWQLTFDAVRRLSCHSLSWQKNFYGLIQALLRYF